MSYDNLILVQAHLACVIHMYVNSRLRFLILFSYKLTISVITDHRFNFITYKTIHFNKLHFYSLFMLFNYK